MQVCLHTWARLRGRTVARRKRSGGIGNHNSLTLFSHSLSPVSFIFSHHPHTSYHPPHTHIHPKQGETPLWTACERGYMDVVKLILTRGKATVDLGIRDEKGRTALYAASEKGRCRVAHAVLVRTFEPPHNRLHTPTLWFAATMFTIDTNMKFPRRTLPPPSFLHS